MTIYEVFADFTITKSIGKFEASSEEEAILKAGSRIRDVSPNCDSADYVWAEDVGE